MKRHKILMRKNPYWFIRLLCECGQVFEGEGFQRRAEQHIIDKPPIQERKIKYTEEEMEKQEQAKKKDRECREKLRQEKLEERLAFLMDGPKSTKECADAWKISPKYAKKWLHRQHPNCGYEFLTGKRGHYWSLTEQGKQCLKK